MTARTVFGLLRLSAAALCLIALIHRLAWGLASYTIASQNFFAYLTNQSNIAFMVLLAIAGVIALQRDRDPRWLTVALALVLTWTITAGLVFALLVWQADVRGIRIDVPWSDQVLHFWLPACTAIAWVLAPGHRSVPWRVIPATLVYPLVWGLFTMIRGPLIGWYPYYFLDPRQVSGPAEFLASSGIALATFAVVATVLVLISRMPVLKLLRRDEPASMPDGDLPTEQERVLADATARR
ncbi:Pr6Pr family membrane protein [Microbacterium croceum]|uniref:Pr6Pr family membrane protein n=1 Tax=Microbacterium croceum TaxID=2851645 RepID=UPI001FFCF3CA|nr:Pr6Pr family membrane protein [Microbacterium croceum]